MRQESTLTHIDFGGDVEEDETKSGIDNVRA